jgi:hypothetical protein
MSSRTTQLEESKYYDYALYSATGFIKGVTINGFDPNPSPLNDWNKGFVTRSGNVFNYICSDSAIMKCKFVIENFPQYPFSYYFLSLCLKEKKDRLWKGYAEKAKSIFEKTTKMPNHHSDQDLFLVKVNTLLYKS